MEGGGVKEAVGKVCEGSVWKGREGGIRREM